MRRVRTFAMAAAAAFVAACATARGGGENITRLEQQRSARPGSESVLRSLGIAYFKANRFADARTVLDEASKLDPKDGVAALYLGMSAEQLNDLPTAHAAYASYLKIGRTRRVRADLEARLAALSRKEMQLAAKSAIAQEVQLAGVPGTPNTVAVLPLSFSGPDTSLKPLERGLAELIVTDLSRSAQLTVVERARMQALVDELALQKSGATDATTNVRAGKIIQAGRLVEGSILQQGQQLRVDASVIDVPTTQVAGSAQDGRALDQVFTIEKNIVFGLFDAMKVTLSTAERDAIEQRPTRSLAAFLAYSNGLKLEDEGRFDDAARMFQDATRLDPNFGAAKQKSQEAQTLSIGSQVTTQTVEQGLSGTPEGHVVQQAEGGNAPSSGAVSIASTVADGVNPSQTGAASAGNSGTGTQSTQKQGAAQGTGTDTPTNNTATVIIVIHKP